MDSSATTAGTLGTAHAGRPVLIAVPFYRNEALVHRLAASLLRCAADIIAIAAEIVFFDDSPDYTPLGEALEHARSTLAALPVRVERNQTNLGFVKTMNRAVAEAAARGMDLIILNSDTVVMPGAFSEMLWVARQDTMHGFVNPRSDNATIATLPLRDRLGARRWQDCADIVTRYTQHLPRLTYVPTAIGFCMFVRWEVIAELGGFDEIYGQGYNEENDMVMRAARLGFRAVLANHAFVAHDGEASFSSAPSTRNELERRNRDILDSRYPEYGGHTRRHYDSPEVVAEQLLATLVPDEDGKLDAALDISSFVAAHNGTMQAGRQLIESAVEQWQDRYNLHVLCEEDVFAFHDLASLGVRRANLHDGRKFALIFRIGQPYDWNAIQRLCLTGAVLGVYMLDTISLDCPRLASTRLQNLWQFTMDHFDVLATQSQQTERTMRLRLRIPERMVRIVSPHSLRLEDYNPNTAAPPAGPARLLVVGNHYDHKYVAPTSNALARAYPDRQVVALGRRADTAGKQDQAERLMDLPNITSSAAGALAQIEVIGLYNAASCVIFPSYAEGFGFPTLHALAAQRPLFAHRLPATEEIWRALGCSPNVHFYDTTDSLIEMLRHVPAWQPDAPPPQQDRLRPAREIRSAMEAALASVDYTTITARVQAMQFASDAASLQAPPARADAEVAARLLATRFETLAQRAFRQKWVFRGTRLAVRSARRVKRVGHIFGL